MQSGGKTLISQITIGLDLEVLAERTASVLIGQRMLNEFLNQLPYSAYVESKENKDNPEKLYEHVKLHLFI